MNIIIIFIIFIIINSNIIKIIIESKKYIILH